MDTKLTLKLNAQIIKEAKQYAKETDTSLSKLIENYLSFVISRQTNQEEKSKRKVDPLVESLTGVISLDEKEDYKKSYGDYLTKKYK